MFEEAMGETPINRWEYETMLSHFNPSAITEVEAVLYIHALGRAIRHVRRIALRDHIKADRLERVTHFITSLRREIMWAFNMKTKTFPEGAIAYFCDKTLWNDAGILVDPARWSERNATK